MSDFSQEIHDFEQNGDYQYAFDSVGNMTFNTASANFNQVYLALPLQNITYNNNKIQTFFDVSFSEFVPQAATSSVSGSEDLQDQLDAAQQQNISLQSQLDSLVSMSEISGSNVATSQAVQQVIIELRISLGQGRVPSDFSAEFPYTPISQTTASLSS